MDNGKLKDAGVSKRDIQFMKMLLEIDEDFFEQNLDNSIVEISKYGDVSREVKALLYRPPKLKELNEKYWHL